MNELEVQLLQQEFGNGYQLVDGVAMHEENPQHFHIPPRVIKRHLKAGQFVELRIDSPRFSVHEDVVADCRCPACQGEWRKPVLRHPQPQSLQAQPAKPPAAKGWGEDFWVCIANNHGDYFRGIVDNEMAESRLHGLVHGQDIFFSADHVLAIHPLHRPELVASMSLPELKELAAWLRSEGNADH